jgi:membrane protein EpsK
MSTEFELLDGITEISERRTVTNAIAHYGQYAVAIVVGIFLQAFIIRALGRNEYAIWPLIFTCIGVMNLIPIGIGSGSERFLAHALGRKDVKEVEQITTSLFVALLVGAAIYTVAIIFLSVYFEKVFDIPEGAKGVGGWAMLLVGLSGAVALPFGVFQGGLRAAQRFVALNIIRIISLVSQLILVIGVFLLGFKSLIWVAGVNLLMMIGSSVATFIVARKAIPWQRIRWSSFNWETLKKVNSFSLLVLVTTVAGLLYWKTDNVIINKLLEPGLLTGYSVIVSFVLYSYQMTSLGTGVLNPVATIMFSQGNLSKITDLIFRANRIIVPLSVAILLFLMVFGSQVLEVYIGRDYAGYGYLFFILAGSAAVSVTQATAGIVPQALNRMALVSIISLCVAIANILLSIYFVVVLKWGLAGVAAGTAIVTVLGRAIWSPWYTSYLLKVRWHRYFWNVNVVPLLNCVPVLCVMLIFRSIRFLNVWAHLIISFIVCAVVHLVFIVLFGIDQRDRNKVFEILRLKKFIKKPA